MKHYTRIAASGFILFASTITAPVFLLHAQTATSATVAGEPHAPVVSAPPSDADALAKQLANPVASLISVPFQGNFDFGYDDGGWRSTTNVQPVVPISISEKWNLIQRIVLPVIYQHNVLPHSTQFGLGDTVATSFFSPKEPTANGVIWGAGPAFLLPTATNDAFASKKWGIGPSIVILKQQGPWTYGILANHLWSFAGNNDTPYVSSTYAQPFATYALGGGASVTLVPEITYDWNSSTWSIPVTLTYSRVIKLRGGNPINIAFGPRVWLDGPDNRADWGIRFVFTLLYPKG